MDLFEYHDTLPAEVQQVLEKYSLESMTYAKCKRLIKKLNEVGYTCDYGLAADPYGLRRHFVKGERYTYAEVTSIVKDEEPDDTEFICTEGGSWNDREYKITLQHKHCDEKAEFIVLGVNGGESIFECTFTNL